MRLGAYRTFCRRAGDKDSILVPYGHDQGLRRLGVAILARAHKDTGSHRANAAFRCSESILQMQFWFRDACKKVA